MTWYPYEQCPYKILNDDLLVTQSTTIETKGPLYFKGTEPNSSKKQKNNKTIKRKDSKIKKENKRRQALNIRRGNPISPEKLDSHSLCPCELQSPFPDRLDKDNSRELGLLQLPACPQSRQIQIELHRANTTASIHVKDQYPPLCSSHIFVLHCLSNLSNVYRDSPGHFPNSIQNLLND
ncbi:hypothetical protein KY289_031189 [Solanum tuberosum]|nr:hypothetical protein KY289_031189 [Solanum tuberosum]